MGRLYDWISVEKPALAGVDWGASAFWSRRCPLAEASDAEWSALRLLANVRGDGVLEEVRNLIRRLDDAWDELLRELIRGGDLGRWWSLAETVLARRRLNRPKLFLLNWWSSDRSEETLRPLAVVPVVVALRHLDEFTGRAALEESLAAERLRAQADLKAVEDELDAVARSLEIDEVYGVAGGEEGCMPHLAALFDRRLALTGRISRLEKAAGGPEAAVGEMVAAVVEDAGGVESVAEFLAFSDDHPDNPRREERKRRVQDLDDEIRQIDMQLDRMARSLVARGDETAGHVARAIDGLNDPVDSRERLGTVLGQFARRLRLSHELHQVRIEAAGVDSRQARLSPITDLLKRAMSGEESARAVVARLAAAVRYPASPEFVRAIGETAWDAIKSSVARLLASGSRVESGTSEDTPGIEGERLGFWPAGADDDVDPRHDHEEFPLPCALGDISSPGNVTPWIGRMLGRDADAVLRVLRDDWAGIDHPALAAYRDLVLTYRPFALARREERWYVGLRRKHDEYDQDTIFLESLPDLEAIDRALESFGFAERELMRDFYRHFYGMTSDVGYPSARFTRPEEWETLAVYGWDDVVAEYDPDRRWERSPIIYHTSTGDLVLLKLDGVSAWALLAEQRITPFAPSFSALLEQFVQTYETYLNMDYYMWIDKWRPER